MESSRARAADPTTALTGDAQPRQVQQKAARFRTPKCARCRNHGYTVNVRGHKGFCPHKNCVCKLCELLTQKQEACKRHLRLWRQKKQEEVIGMYVPVPSSIMTSGSLSPIVKIKTATQWPENSCENNANVPPTFNTTIISKGRQKFNGMSSANTSHSPSAYSLSRALTLTQVTPIESLPLPSEIFSAMYSRSEIKQYIFRSEKLSTGSYQQPLEGFEASVTGSVKAHEEASSKAGLGWTSKKSETSAVQQGLISSMSGMPELETRQPLKTTSGKVSRIDCESIYTSSSTMSISWLNAPASMSVPKLSMPFGQPLQPPLLSSPSSWEPCSVPSLHFLQTSVASIFHSTSYQLSPPLPHLPPSPALSHAKTDPSAEKAACPNHGTLVAGERLDQVKADASILDVCQDLEITDPTNLDIVSE